MTNATESPLLAWRWDQRVFPHAALCSEHAEIERVARAERMRGDLSVVHFQDVGLPTLADAIDDVRAHFSRPAEGGCSRGQCRRRLAQVGVEWDDLTGEMAAADLAPLAANASILRFLEAGAEPASSERSRADPRPHGWELRCHPDLAERLSEAAGALQASLLYSYGLPVLVHPNGVAFAVATGTSFVLLRLPMGEREDLQRSQWDSDGLDDPEWIDVEPWLDLPEPEPRRRLGRWISRAFEYATLLGAS